jgi:hypothetical protein
MVVRASNWRPRKEDHVKNIEEVFRSPLPVSLSPATDSSLPIIRNGMSPQEDRDMSEEEQGVRSTSNALLVQHIFVSFGLTS